MSVIEGVGVLAWSVGGGGVETASETEEFDDERALELPIARRKRSLNGILMMMIFVSIDLRLLYRVDVVSFACVVCCGSAYGS